MSFYAREGEIKKGFVLKSTNDCAFVQRGKIDSSLPSVVVSLLQDFDEVFSEEVPNGLPPIRGIEHQIDFVPSASHLTLDF